MAKTEGRNTPIIKRQTRVAEKQVSPDSPNSIWDQETVTALKKEIKRLEAENKNLRDHIAALSASPRQPARMRNTGCGLHVDRSTSTHAPVGSTRARFAAIPPPVTCDRA